MLDARMQYLWEQIAQLLRVLVPLGSESFGSMRNLKATSLGTVKLHTCKQGTNSHTQTHTHTHVYAPCPRARGRAYASRIASVMNENEALCYLVRWLVHPDARDAPAGVHMPPVSS